jgi:hypothetical protein
MVQCSRIRVSATPRSDSGSDAVSQAAVLPQLPVARIRFAPNHRWDRNFFAFVVALIWLGILMGFGPQVLQRLQMRPAAYPLIVHVHAALFVGWLLLLTTQLFLIRAHRLDLHRRLGVYGAALAGVMIVVGPATALVMHAVTFGKGGKPPAFLAVQFIDILAFASLIGAALAWRQSTAAHKRLILLGTLYISDAGFSRWLNAPLTQFFGQGFWPYALAQYLPSDLVVLGIGAYDVVTRGRLHPAYAAGVLWTGTLQIAAVALMFSSWWPPIALHLIGR